MQAEAMPCATYVCCGGTTHVHRGLSAPPGTCTATPVICCRTRHLATVAGACRQLQFMLTPTSRRVLQAVLYEVFAIAVVAPLLSVSFDKPQASTFGLALVLSTIALTWNYAFNWIFERWESRQAVRGRSFRRRLAHGAGFEGGLAVILIPVMSFWLDISPAMAFAANLGLLMFFFVYAIVFTWAFDRVFGLPASALKSDTVR